MGQGVRVKVRVRVRVRVQVRVRVRVRVRVKVGVSRPAPGPPTSDGGESASTSPPGLVCSEPGSVTSAPVLVSCASSARARRASPTSAPSEGEPTSEPTAEPTAEGGEMITFPRRRPPGRPRRGEVRRGRRWSVPRAVCCEMISPALPPPAAASSSVGSSPALSGFVLKGEGHTVGLVLGLGLGLGVALLAHQL